MNWKKKLSSRKLWAMIADFAGMIVMACGVAQTTTERIVAMILAGGGIIAYIFAEGMADASHTTITNNATEAITPPDEEDM